MDIPDVQRIRHILMYCQWIGEAIDRFGRDVIIFCDDRDYRNTVCMMIMQIGELSNGLSEEFRQESKDDMQWAAMRGLRNLVAHSYHKVNMETIWKIATQDIPALRAFCEQTIAEADNT